MSVRSRVGGPLAPYESGFVDELSRLGYTPGSAAHQLRLMACLSRWLAEQGVLVGALAAPLVEQFLAVRRAAGHKAYLTPMALAPLLEYLHRLGVVGKLAAVPVSQVDVLQERYRRYLLVERGLAVSTVAVRVRAIRPFLAARVADGGELELTTLTAVDVASFMLMVARTGRCARAAAIASALRSLLRFLHVDGVVAGSLVGAVPSVASWQLAALPRGLEPAQVARLVGACDRRSAAGRRDAAMILLMVRLGLRASEVALLTLDDVDWRSGEIVVRGKGGRRERVPLPDDVGQAVAGYLRRGRPPTAQGRQVFVRLLAPHRGLTSEAVSMAVRTAARRGGLGSVGAHRLRHSAATRLLSVGAPLVEIGQLLRHRKASTTALYAKVDRQALRRLARPWPGAA